MRETNLTPMRGSLTYSRNPVMNYSRAAYNARWDVLYNWALMSDQVSLIWRFGGFSSSLLGPMWKSCAARGESRCII